MCKDLSVICMPCLCVGVVYCWNGLTFDCLSFFDSSISSSGFHVLNNLDFSKSSRLQYVWLCEPVPTNAILTLADKIVYSLIAVCVVEQLAGRSGVGTE